MPRRPAERTAARIIQRLKRWQLWQAWPGGGTKAEGGGWGTCRARPKENESAQGRAEPAARFKASRFTVACCSDWPPLRNTMPGTAAGTHLRREHAAFGSPAASTTNTPAEQTSASRTYTTAPKKCIVGSVHAEICCSQCRRSLICRRSVGAACCRTAMLALCPADRGKTVRRAKPVQTPRKHVAATGLVHEHTRGVLVPTHASSCG